GDETSTQGDVMFGEAGNDEFRIVNSNFAKIDGGDDVGHGDYDRITLNAAGETLDLTAASASKIVDIEVISMTASTGGILTLINTDIPKVNSTGNFLYVLGGSDDQVTVGGDTWVLVTTNHTNNSVAPGVTFFQYHNGITNSELYIANT